MFHLSKFHPIVLRNCTVKSVANVNFLVSQNVTSFRNTHESGFQTSFQITRNFSQHSVKELRATKVEPLNAGSKEFKEFLPEIIRVSSAPQQEWDSKEAQEWMAKVLEYNAMGKIVRGLLTVFTYKRIANPQDLTPENIRLANILGWCVELCQSLVIVADDLIDNSDTRRGKLCWHKQPDVGVSSINDLYLMSSAMFIVLKHYFKDDPSYCRYIEILNEMIFITSIGQNLDMATSRGGKPNLETFTMDRFNDIAKYKTSYTFTLVLKLAMAFAKIDNPQGLERGSKILLNIGRFYQIQNDYIDCFADSSVLGKHSSDIEEGKCTWLAVKVLERANKSERDLMSQLYGSSDPEHVQTIKNLYEHMGLRNLYDVEENNMFGSILKDANDSVFPPPDIFLTLLHRFYDLSEDV